MADEINKKQKFSTSVIYVFIILPIIITIVVMIWSNLKGPPSSPNDTVQESSYVQVQTYAKYGVWHEKLTPNIPTRKYVVPKNSNVHIDRMNSEVPYEILFILPDNTEEITKIASASTGANSKIPGEYKSFRLKSKKALLVKITVEESDI